MRCNVGITADEAAIAATVRMVYVYMRLGFGVGGRCLVVTRRALAASSTPLGRVASGLQMRCVAVVHERGSHGGWESASAGVVIVMVMT